MLSKQTVYKKRADCKLILSSLKGIDRLDDVYVFTEEQLIAVLQTAFDYGVQRVQMGKLTPDRNTFIKELLK